MADGDPEISEDEVDSVASAEGPTGGAPPVRRGSRDERRELTLQSFGAGREARCAYCGRSLPPIPPRGGRPTPYCAADPERYGRWGAKAITCAMLDECREIWVSVYGAEQPMTQVDVRVLDERATALLVALDPVREEIAALRERAGEETTAALAAKAVAEQAQAHAETRAGEAEAEKSKAVAEAEQARQEAAASRTRVEEAEELAARAAEEKDAAADGRRAAEEDKAKAVADRERALTLLSAAQNTIAELQTTLAGERATALESLDRVRHEETQARQNLRATLTEEHEQRLRASAADFDQRTRAMHAETDRRVAELNNQLASATRTYAEALAPLHDQLTGLRAELAERTTTATGLRRKLDDLRTAVGGALDETTDEEPLRHRISAALERDASP